MKFYRALSLSFLAALAFTAFPRPSWAGGDKSEDDFYLADNDSGGSQYKLINPSDEKSQEAAAFEAQAHELDETIEKTEKPDDAYSKDKDNTYVLQELDKTDGK